MACAVSVLALSACAPATAPVASASPGTTVPTSTSPSSPPPSSPPPYDPAPLLAQIAEAAAPLGGRISVVVRDADGEHVLADPGTDEVTPTASLVKVVLVARLLALGRDGALGLTGEDLALMERAVATSDDAAMNTLWTRYDGARLVADAAAWAGLSRTGPPAMPGQWGEATTTAREFAGFLAVLPGLLHEDDVRTLLGWMRAASAVAADGFDQRFGLLLGSGAPVAAKQGWMCCVGGRRVLHSAGVLANGLVVVLLGDFPAGTSWSQARTALDTAATAVLARKG